MDIAKVLRNTAITTAHREIVTRALANYFEREDQFFDRKMFNQIASGTLDFDHRTVAYSTVQEKVSPGSGMVNLVADPSGRK